ncbi:MAG: hypothetical protein Hals2KO_28050 [Halioglobus sp.]
MINPTSNPDVNRIAQNAKRELGREPSQMVFPQRRTMIAEVSRLTATAMVNIVFITMPDPR